jgi:hypothetical protein
MVLLSEWNDGAIALIMVLFLLPVIIVFFLLLFLLRLSPTIKSFIDKIKQQSIIVYFAILLLLFAATALLTFGAFYIFAYMPFHSSQA